MKNKHNPTANSTTDFCDQIPVARLESLTREWLSFCRLEFSHRTVELRSDLMKRFLAYMQEAGFEDCGVAELREFFAYLSDGHRSAGGRWGNRLMNKPLSQNTIATYYRNLRAFFNWLVKEERLAQSPMERLPRKRETSDQIQPFTEKQIEALLEASKRTRHPRRDEAIVRLMLDTGVRCSELCQATVEHLNLEDGFLRIVHGKGNRERRLYFGRRTHRALWKYFISEGHTLETARPNEPIFYSDRGRNAGEALTRSGLFQMIQRLGLAAKIRGVRCSPHTFRHSYAVMFLRAGGDAASLKTTLGHTTLKMTLNYIALSDADMQTQQRAFSPVDRLKA